MQVETHPYLLLVVDPPGDDGAAVEVDGAGGVVAPVHGDHRDVASHDQSVLSD